MAVTSTVSLEGMAQMLLLLGTTAWHSNLPTQPGNTIAPCTRCSGAAKFADHTHRLLVLRLTHKGTLCLQMIHMGCFDEDGDGALLDSQLQSYIAALVPELPALQGLQASMSVVTYAQIAARKFLFFHGKKGK